MTVAFKVRMKQMEPQNSTHTWLLFHTQSHIHTQVPEATVTTGHSENIRSFKASGVGKMKNGYIKV